MREPNVFFLKAREFGGKPLLTCAPSDTVAEVARRMSERNVSSVVVCEDGVPIGILTDRDFRNKIIPSGMNSKEVRAAGIMASPVVCISEEDFLFEAMYRMSRHNIHRLVVVDGQGRAAGIVTDSDVMRLQTDTPQNLLQDLEHAETLGELPQIHRKVVDLVVRLSRTGVRTVDLTRLISHISDALVQRLIAILVEKEFSALPGPFAFLALGSEGRMEQTLKTDQDNALVYGDDLGREDLRVLEEFSVRLSDSLVAIGVPPCPGGVMAKNEPWRRSLSAWQARVDEWVSVPSPENILSFSMFSDLRTLFGDRSLESEIKAHLGRRLDRSSVFLAQLAKNVLRFPPPVSFFGRVKVEQSGDHWGRVDVKKAGIFAITEGVRVLALEAGSLEGGTLEKLGVLEQKGVLSKADREDIQATFVFFSFLRLRSQVQDIVEGREPSNHVDPESLSSIERSRLKIGLGVVKSFQGLLKSHFKLNFVAD